MTTSPNTTLRQNERKKLILSLIRNTANASRTLVKQLSGISMSSTLDLIEELLAEGLIRSPGKEECTGVGRRATLLEINPDGCFFIGVRFNAGSVTAVTVDFRHAIRDGVRRELPPGVGAEELLSAIEACVDDLCRNLGDRKALLRGVGVGSPGVIDLKNGVIRRYVHVPDLIDAPLRQRLADRFQVPVYLEHGIRCSARALMAMPAYRRCRNLLLIQLDRGVTMSIVADGRVYDGAGPLAGEIGHLRVAENGDLCECGHRGCLETVAASEAVYARIRAQMREGRFAGIRHALDGGEKLTVSLINRLAVEGDGECRALLGEIGRSVGVALSAALILLNPDTVVVSGLLADTECFRLGIQDTLKDRCLPESLAAVRIDYRRSDPQFDAFGAAELPFSREFDPPENSDAER